MFDRWLIDLSDDVFDNGWRFDAGEPFFKAVTFEEKFFVVEAELVEDGGVEIMNTDRIFNDFVAEVVGGAVGGTALDTAAGDPTGERLHVMVAAGVGIAGFLSGRRATELAAPYDECGIEQADLFEVTQQRGDRFVSSTAGGQVVIRQVCVAIPGLFFEEDLHVAHAAFDEAASEQATSREGIGFFFADAVHGECAWFFAREINRVACRELHARRKTVGFDAGVELRIVWALRSMHVIEAIE